MRGRSTLSESNETTADEIVEDGPDLVVSGDSVQFPCPSCGAKLQFAPGDDSLSCSHCGYAEGVPNSSEAIAEYDFDAAPRGASAGWGTERTDYACTRCGATTAVEPHVTSFACAFCGSDQVVQRESDPNRLRPESLLPFKITAETGADAFRAWLAKLWFRPNALKKFARPGQLQGVYLPFWTYDTLTHSLWRAQSGTYYYVTQSYTDSNGQRRTRRVRKTRWRWVRGNHDRFFDDVLESGSPSVDRELLLGLEPFPTKQLEAYRPEFLAGFLAEDYRDDVHTCWPRAKGRIDDTIRTEIIRRIPGDTHRFLSVDSSYLSRAFKLCLLPIWVGSYTFRGKLFPFAVNGHTAKVSGRAPYSWLKIGAVAIVVIAIIAAIFLAQR